MKDCIHPDVKNRGENPEIESAWELGNNDVLCSFSNSFV